MVILIDLSSTVPELKRTPTRGSMEGVQCTVHAHAVRYGGVYRPREGVAHYCTEAPPMSPLGVLLYALPL